MSLKYRIAIASFLLHLTALSAVFWLALSASLQTTERELHGSEQNVVTLLGGPSRDALLAQQYTELQGLFKTTASDADVDRVLLLERGRVVASSTPSDLGQPWSPGADGAAGRWQSLPLSSPNGRRGTLYVQFSGVPAQNAQRGILQLGLTVAGAAILLSAIAGLLAGAFVTRRLGPIGAASRAIVAGNLGQRVQLNGRDEIAELARGVNDMVCALHQEILVLRESQERFTLAMRATRDGIWDMDLNNRRVLFFNDFKQTLGYEEVEVADTFEGWTALVHPEERERVVIAVQAHARTGEPFQLEFRLRCKDAGYRWILLRGQARLDDRGVPGRMLGSCTDINDRKLVEEELGQVSRRLRLVLDSVGDGISGVDRDGKVTLINAAASRMLGYEAEELIGKHIHELVHHTQPDGTPHPAEQCPACGSFRDGKVHRVADGLFWTKQGHPLPVEYVSTPIQQRGALVGAVIAFRDVTERREAQAALHQEKERALVTLSSIGDGVMTTSVDGLIEYMNPVAEHLTGWKLTEAKGQPLHTVLNILDEATGSPPASPVEIALREGRITGLAQPAVLLRSDGTEFPIVSTAAPIRGHHGDTVGAVLVFHDISLMRRMEQQLSHQAAHDAMTGLLNRREFERRLERALETATDSGKVHAVCYLDLDQFKIVNDTCGHVAGDELLRQLAELLQRQVRKADTLARLGGDEFGVLLEDCPLDRAARIANKLRQAIRAYRFVWQDRTFLLGVSIGLVPIGSETGGLPQVMSAADEACYLAKEKGRNRIHVYEPDDREISLRRGEMQWVARIHEAFERGQLLLYYQPIVPLFDNAPPGAHHEILVRMRDRDTNIFPPMAFIPAAERYDLMPAIDRWVVTNALEAYGCQLREGAKLCLDTCAINLSGVSISDDDFLGFVKDVLKRNEIPVSTISFEITETAAISNLTKASRFIRELKDLGCRFALDDFGSGFSSFAYLKNLPVDYVKIDGSFVRNMVNDPIDRAMVQAINQIGHVLGVKTIAEFVEDDETLEALRSMGVDYAQGYHVAPPRPLSELCYGSRGELGGAQVR